jgi:acetolactate synthase-1/2/3 large subunit
MPDLQPAPPSTDPPASTSARRRAADLLVDCLVAEACPFVFSVPGEETMDILDALAERTDIRHVTTRHEQGAAFMADVHGRLTGRAAVAMGTLGPGATNLVTGIADAYLDRAPMVAITGQAASYKLHKEAHQVVDIVRMMEPVTKWNTRIDRADVVPEVVRKAFRVATLEKPGPTHIELPEDIAATVIADEADGGPRPIQPGRAYFPEPTDEAIAHAADLLAASERPLILSGNGVVRRGASAELRALARGLHVPVAVTFMGKGATDDRSHLSLMAVGLQARDHVLSGFDRADLVICIGYDLVEYAPASWNPDGTKRIVHIDTQPAEIDAAYQPLVELVGDIDGTLRRLLEAVLPSGIGGRTAEERHASREVLVHADLRTQLLEELLAHEANDAWPITPQRAIADLRRALGPSDIVVSDVGAHKVWVARLYQAYEPNTVIISNGFASMGIAVPGAIAAALVHPERKVVALSGDGGFLMNSQELETATRLGVDITVIVWRDDGYGLIDWKQRNEFGRPFAVEFGNPDFIDYARSFGIPAFRPSSAADLYPTLERAIAIPGPSLVEVPIDYAENLRLTERLGALSG